MMTDADILLNLTVRLDALDARLDRIESRSVARVPVKPAPAPKPGVGTVNPGAAPFPMGWDRAPSTTCGPLADLFDTLRRLLPGTNADGSPLSDADILARAIDKITTLETEADLAAWRSVATEPPIPGADVLFANGSRIWVGQAREVTFTDMDMGKEATEIAYYEDGDLSDGEAPVAWAILPILEDPADPGLDPVI